MGVTTIFRDNASRQRSNERLDRSPLDGCPLRLTQAGEKTGFTITFSLSSKVPCVCIFRMVQKRLSCVQRGKEPFANPWIKSCCWVFRKEQFLAQGNTG